MREGAPWVVATETVAAELGATMAVALAAAARVVEAGSTAVVGPTVAESHSSKGRRLRMLDSTSQSDRDLRSWDWQSRMS